MPRRKAAIISRCGDQAFRALRRARCRSSTIKDIAREFHLSWHAVEEPENEYVREQRRRLGTPGPRIIGTDEISIRMGEVLRIVASDLVRQRPLFFGGRDRSEPSLDEFFDWLGEKKATQARLAVMDMWKASTT